MRDGIERSGKRKSRVRHANLFAIVHARYTANGQLEHGEQLRISKIVAGAVNTSVFIMIAKNIDGHKWMRILSFHVPDQFIEIIGSESETHHPEVEDHR